MAGNRFRIPTLEEIDNAAVVETSNLSKFKDREKITITDQTASTSPTTSTLTAPGHGSEGRSTSTKIQVNHQEVQKSSSDSSNENETNFSKPAAIKSVEHAQAVSSASTKSSSSLIVNTRQRGNPILKHVRNIAWEYGNIVPDYVMGQANCAIFLSLRYHQLHPNYIHERLKQLGRSYELRVMLVQVDVKDPQHLLKDIAKICILADCTLILAFSAEEAGRYLETYKIFEHKPPEAIMEKTEGDFMSKFTDCITKVKSVNKTDCATLISQFHSLSNIIDASEEDLSLCPGFGPQKAKRLHSLFHEPFRRQTQVWEEMMKENDGK